MRQQQRNAPMLSTSSIIMIPLLESEHAANFPQKLSCAALIPPKPADAKPLPPHFTSSMLLPPKPVSTKIILPEFPQKLSCAALIPPKPADAKPLPPHFTSSMLLLPKPVSTKIILPESTASRNKIQRPHSRRTLSSGNVIAAHKGVSCASILRDPEKLQAIMDIITSTEALCRPELDVCANKAAGYKLLHDKFEEFEKWFEMEKCKEIVNILCNGIIVGKDIVINGLTFSRLSLPNFPPSTWSLPDLSVLSMLDYGILDICLPGSGLLGPIFKIGRYFWRLWRQA